jgi:hypothetical protein
MNWSAEIRFADMRSEAGISCKLEHPECAFVFGCSRVISSTGAILPYPKQERVEHEHYLTVVRSICVNHNPFSVTIVHTNRQISTEDV